MLSIRNSTPLWARLNVPNTGGDSTVAMDGQDNFVVSWDVLLDADITGQTSEGVYATEYQLESYTAGVGSPATGTAAGRSGRSAALFRVNSGSTNIGSQTDWPFHQATAEVEMALDGDIASTYEGNGPGGFRQHFDPADFFRSDFSLEQQQLTFNFPAAFPPRRSARSSWKWARSLRCRSLSTPTPRSRRPTSKPRW